MRFFHTALATTAILILVSPTGIARAQDKAGIVAPAGATAPKQITLTQKSLDGLVAAQKDIRDLEAKMPKDAKEPDPKIEAQINATMTKNGFATADDFANTSYSVGIVLVGMDPDTGKFIGAEAATKKQIDEVKADKQMPPKEKKETLDELEQTMMSTDKPPQGNIDLVTANLAKLSEGLNQTN